MLWLGFGFRYGFHLGPQHRLWFGIRYGIGLRLHRESWLCRRHESRLRHRRERRLCHRHGIGIGLNWLHMVPIDRNNNSRVIVRVAVFLDVSHNVLDALFQRGIDTRSVDRLVSGTHKEMHCLLVEVLVVKLGHQKLQNTIRREQEPLYMLASPDLPLVLAVQRKRARFPHTARMRNEFESGIGLCDNARVARGAIEQLLAIVNGNCERRIELAGRQLHRCGFLDHSVICLDHGLLQKTRHRNRQGAVACRAPGANQLAHGRHGGVDGGMGTDIAMGLGTQTIRHGRDNVFLARQESIPLAAILPNRHLLDATDHMRILATRTVAAMCNASFCYTANADGTRLAPFLSKRHC